MSLEVALDGCHRPTQLCPVLAVARVAKGGKPLMGMGLQDGGAGADDFPSLAPSVARGTQRAQAPLGSRPIQCFRQGTLAGRLSRAINVEDEQVVPLSVPQSARLLLLHEGTSQQILEKQRAQRLNRRLIEAAEKAAERRTRRQPVASEERHERACPGQEPLVKGFQRPFAADGIAE